MYFKVMSVRSNSSGDSEEILQMEEQSFTATGYPVLFSVAGNRIAPGLVDTVSTNLRIVFNALGIPAAAVLYYRVRCSGKNDDSSHMFIAVDEREQVVRVSPARLSLITSTIDTDRLKLYTASVTADPLGALLLTGPIPASGERFNRFPPIFGYKAPKGDKQLYDRRAELQVLRRDGYLAMTFLPVPGVDHRMQLTTEIASLWGYSLAAYDHHWPDLLVLRNDIPERDDLGGVPDETWLHHALSRVLEDHLPIVEVDGLWMGSLPRDLPGSLPRDLPGSLPRNVAQVTISRAKVFYAVLDWVRMRRLPYITARTFHCYVRRDLSCVVALGSLRDRTELVAWLEAYSFNSLNVDTAVNGEIAVASAVFSDGRAASSVTIGGSTSLPRIAVATGSEWLIVGPRVPPKDTNNLEQELRAYYGSPQACSAPGSPLTSQDVAKMPLAKLLKIVRIAECEAAITGVCLLPGEGSRQSMQKSWTTSHRAYRSAVRTHTLRTHETLGVYRLGPFASPFFAFDVHQYIAMPKESRYKPVVSQVRLAPEEGESEDRLLKTLVGTVWLLSVKEEATALTPASDIEVIQVATDRDPETVRKILFQSWRTGHIIGVWCRVMLTHRETLSISVAGGTVDPLVAHAGDSIVDGNRWLDITEHAMTECSTL